MMATVRHVTSSSGLRKFQTDGFLFVGVYKVTCTYIVVTLGTCIRILTAFVGFPDGAFHWSRLFRAKDREILFNM